MNYEKQVKASLQSKSDKVIIIINPNENTPLNGQKDYLKACMNCIINCNTLGFFRASIIHDRDTTENGEPKTIHLHAFLHAKEQRTLKEWLSLIAEITKANKEQISIEATNNEILQVQYLRHDRKEAKAKYETAEIMTNDSQELEKRLSAEYSKPKDPIEEAIMSCETLIELIQEVGVNKANQLRGLFKDIHSERDLLRSYHQMETDLMAIRRFATELMATLQLTLKDNKCRLDNYRYWADYADKLDLY